MSCRSALVFTLVVTLVQPPVAAAALAPRPEDEAGRAVRVLARRSPGDGPQVMGADAISTTVPGGSDEPIESVLDYIDVGDGSEVVFGPTIQVPGVDPNDDPFGDIPEGPAYGDGSRPPTEEEIRRLLGVDDEPEDEPVPDPAPPVPHAGITLTTPDGQPLTDVALGQPFGVEVRIPVSARYGGQTLTVKIRNAFGEEDEIEVEWDGQDQQDGLWTYRTPEPVSVGGETTTTNLDVDGTIDDIDHENGQALNFSVDAVGGVGGGSLVVFDDDVQQGRNAIEGILTNLSSTLGAEQAFLNRLSGLVGSQDPDDQAGLAALGVDVDASDLADWQHRIDKRRAAIVAAREALSNEGYIPAVQIAVAKHFISLLVQRETGEDGQPRWGVVDGSADNLDPRTWFLTSIVENERQKVQDQFYTEVVAGYLLGVYSTFVHVTLAAPIYTLLSGENEFGQTASRGWALVELGGVLVFMKLPAFLVEWGAGGFRINTPGVAAERALARLGFRAPGVRATTGGGRVIVPSRPGRLAAETARGELPLPATRTSRGLSTEELTFWNEEIRAEIARIEPRFKSSRQADRIEQLTQLDGVVAEARRRGVPEEVIANVVEGARQASDLPEALYVAERRLEIRSALSNDERIFVAPDELEVLREFLPGDDAVTTLEHGIVSQVVAKAHLEAQGRPQVWTTEELRYVQGLLSRGDTVLKWRRPDILAPPEPAPGSLQAPRGEPEFAGLEPLITTEDLQVLRGVFRPGNRIQLEPPPTPPGSRPPIVRSGASGARSAAESGETVIEGRPPRAGTGTETLGAGGRRSSEPSGGTDVPSAPPPAAAPLPRDPRYLDHQIVQKAIAETELRNAAKANGVPVPAGFNDWSPEQLTRLRLLARNPGEYRGFLPSLDGAALGAVREAARTPRGSAAAAGVSGPVPVFDDLLLFKARAWRSGDEPVWTTPELDRAIELAGDPSRYRGFALGLSEADVALLRQIDGTLSADTVILPARVPDPAPIVPERAGPGDTQVLPREELPGAGLFRADPAADPYVLGGPSGPAGSRSPLEAVFVSTGGSTGPVLELLVNNDDGRPVFLDTSGLVLEPIEHPDAATLDWVQRIRQAVSAGKPGAMRVPLDGYCLQSANEVPTEGLLFRVAGRDTQRRAGAISAILAASRGLQASGGLSPDSDPDGYFDSIRQWTIWVYEDRLDRAGFERAFLAHVRKNYETGGRRWSADVERVVRTLVPHRWDELNAILREAGLDTRQ